MNNKGFSLVELVIATAISSIVLLGITVFMSTSVRVYSSLYNTSNLQVQAHIIKAQIKKKLVNCNSGIYFDEEENILSIVNLNDDGTKTMYCYKLQDSTLFFGTVQGTSESDNETLVNFMNTSNNINSKMSDSVKEFTVITNDRSAPLQEIILNITFEKNGKILQTENNIYLPNKPNFSSDIFEVLSS